MNSAPTIATNIETPSPIKNKYDFRIHPLNDLHTIDTSKHFHQLKSKMDIVRSFVQDEK